MQLVALVIRYFVWNKRNEWIVFTVIRIRTSTATRKWHTTFVSFWFYYLKKNVLNKNKNNKIRKKYQILYDNQWKYQVGHNQLAIINSHHLNRNGIVLKAVVPMSCSPSGKPMSAKKKKGKHRSKKIQRKLKTNLEADVEMRGCAGAQWFMTFKRLYATLGGVFFFVPFLPSSSVPIWGNTAPKWAAVYSVR